MNVDAARGRALIEESPELVLVLDSEGRVLRFKAVGERAGKILFALTQLPIDGKDI